MTTKDSACCEALADSSANKQDLRITKTKAALQDALLLSIAQQGWDDVTIQSVCKLANVGRSTFYLHYPTKEALLTDGLNGLRDTLLLIRKNDPRIGNFAFLPELLQHMVEQKNVFKAVCGRRSGQGVERHFRDMVTQLVQHEMDALHPMLGSHAWLATSASGLIVEAMVWWVETPNPPKVNVLVQQLTTVLNGMFSQADAVTNPIFAAKPAPCPCAPIRAAGSKHAEMGIRNLDV